MAKTFALDIANFVEKAKGNANLVQRKVCLDVASSVIMLTPVDRGIARGGWQASAGDSPILGEGKVLDPDGRKAIEAANRVIGRLQLGQPFWIVNDVEYIGSLERGHSRKAPNGMVEITAKRFQGYVNGAAAKVKQ